jgi:acetoin utilization deacetylase AcuC-like enzyme
MRVFYTDQFRFPLPEGHRFPIDKYGLLRKSIVAAGLVAAEELAVPEPATTLQLLLAHDRSYVIRVCEGLLTPKEVRRIGLPWSPELVERARRSVGGTIAACRAALNDGWGINLAGGTHHAFRDHGQGYCLFNDVVIAARTMQAEGRIERAVVLDCDVHQGNGTAAITADDPSIFTFSIHSQQNFPLFKEQSDLDIGLEDDTGDAAYLEALDKGLRSALQLADAGLALYLAGADPHRDDLLGRLALSKKGLGERDRLVFGLCRKAGVPVATMMAGGYGRRMDDTVQIHVQTVRIAVEMVEAAITGQEGSWP